MVVCVSLCVSIWSEIILSNRVLFEVGGLDGGSEHHIASIEGRPQIFLRLCF